MKKKNLCKVLIASMLVGILFAGCDKKEDNTNLTFEVEGETDFAEMEEVDENIYASFPSTKECDNFYEVKSSEEFKPFLEEYDDIYHINAFADGLNKDNERVWLVLKSDELKEAFEISVKGIYLQDDTLYINVYQSYMYSSYTSLDDKKEIKSNFLFINLEKSLTDKINNIKLSVQNFNEDDNKPDILTQEEVEALAVTANPAK